MEGENVTLEIILLDDIIQPLNLTVHTEDISADSASDYRALDQSLTFQPAGATSLMMVVQALPDNHAELVETFRVVLSQPSLGIEENATVDIIDSNGTRKNIHLMSICISPPLPTHSFLPLLPFRPSYNSRCIECCCSPVCGGA